MISHLFERPGQRSSDGGLGWKSGVLGVGLGAVLLGAVLLARVDAADKAAAAPASPAASLPVQPIVVRVPVPVPASDQSGRAEVLVADPSLLTARPATAAAIELPPLPQKPVFQQPITRTRRS